MKKINKLTWILMLCPFLSVSQVLEPLQDQPDDIINGAYKKEHNQQKEEAYAYPVINEKDTFSVPKNALRSIRQISDNDGNLFIIRQTN